MIGIGYAEEGKQSKGGAVPKENELTRRSMWKSTWDFG